MSKGQDRVLFLLERRLDLVERRPSADRSADLVDLGAVGLEAVGKAARSGVLWLVPTGRYGAAEERRRRGDRSTANGDSRTHASPK